MDCNKRVISLVRSSLKEDIGRKDITTALLVPEKRYIKAVLLAKEDCVLCGLDIAKFVFKARDKRIKFRPKSKDGQLVKKGKVLATVEGRAQPILTAERVALNFLSLLCGVATQTKAFVDAVKPYKAKIMDTRKTLPGLRELEKYAVRVGGGYNHRMRLDEMVLVKDNHIAVTSHQSPVASLGYISREVRKKMPQGMKLEIEVKNLKEFKEALELRPDIIMLDNMPIKDMERTVRIRRTTHDARRTTKLEASGRVTLKNIRRIAATGVDMISTGALTHSVKAIDISLEVCSAMRENEDSG